MVQQLLLNGLIAGSIYALVALGFTIIYRTVGFFHFAHGIVYTAGAYVAYTVAIQLHGHFIIAFLAAVACAALLGFLINWLVYVPLRKKNASNLMYLLASFGVFIFLQNLFQLVYGAQILTLRTGPVREGFHVLAAVITPTQILIVVVSGVLMLALWLFIQKTRLGKAMRAVSDDPVAASVVGINPEKTISMSFLLGSALAGAAGVLIALETNIEPTMGFSAILKGIVASIMGGIGSVPGAMFGGVFLGLVENLGIAWIPSAWKDTIAFAILILFLLIRPRGIFGIPGSKEVA